MEGTVRSVFASRDSGCQSVSGFLDGERQSVTGTDGRSSLQCEAGRHVRVNGVTDNTVTTFPLLPPGKHAFEV